MLDTHRITSPGLFARQPGGHRYAIAAALIVVGALGTVVLTFAGASPGAVTVPVSLGLLVALAIVPFPSADRWLALGLIGTFPLLPPIGLPNVPLAAGVIGVALVRLAAAGGLSIGRRSAATLALLWAALAVGIALSHWPPLSVWLRPMAVVLVGVAASVLGVLVWSNAARRDRWLDGVAIGAVIVAGSAIVVFAMQYVAPATRVSDVVEGMMGYFRGDLAAAKFAEQNNWVIAGERPVLRAVSPLFPAPNYIGGYLGVVLPLIGARWATAAAGPWRTLAAVAFACGTLTLVLTLSRSSWLAAAVAATAIGAVVVANAAMRSRVLQFDRARIRRAFLVLAVAGGLGVAGIVSVGQRGVEVRLLRPLEDASVQGRVGTGQDAVAGIRADPIRGVGLGNWTATNSEGSYVHNVYLEYAAATGVFGAAWAVLLVVIPAAVSISILRRGPPDVGSVFALGLLAIALFNGVQFVFDDNLLGPQYAWLTFWTIGATLGLRDWRRTDVDREPSTATP